MPEHEVVSGTSEDGPKALPELMTKYSEVPESVIRATIEKFAHTNMKAGHDPDDYFMEKTVSCSEVKMDEPIYDHTFKGIGVREFTGRHKHIIVMYSGPTFHIEQMQSTMRHLFLNKL